MNATHIDGAGRNYARVVVADGEVKVRYWPKKHGTSRARPYVSVRFPASHMRPDGSVHGWKPIIAAKGEV